MGAIFDAVGDDVTCGREDQNVKTKRKLQQPVVTVTQAEHVHWIISTNVCMSVCRFSNDSKN